MSMTKPMTSVVVGTLLGLVGAKYLFVGSALSLIVWGIAGLALGVWSETNKESIKNGAIYGFFLAFMFMVFGYGGVAPLVTRVLPFAILGLVGAVCGVVLGVVGSYAAKALQPTPRRK